MADEPQPSLWRQLFGSSREVAEAAITVIGVATVWEWIKKKMRG